MPHYRGRGPGSPTGANAAARDMTAPFSTMVPSSHCHQRPSGTIALLDSGITMTAYTVTAIPRHAHPHRDRFPRLRRQPAFSPQWPRFPFELTLGEGSSDDKNCNGNWRCRYRRMRDLVGDFLHKSSRSHGRDNEAGGLATGSSAFFRLHVLGSPAMRCSEGRNKLGRLCTLSATLSLALGGRFVGWHTPKNQRCLAQQVTRIERAKSAIAVTCTCGECLHRMMAAARAATELTMPAKPHVAITYPRLSLRSSRAMAAQSGGFIACRKPFA